MTRRLSAGLAAGLLTAFASMSVLLATPIRGSASGPTVYGAGSTWVAIALDQWRADIARQGYSIDYESNGSSAGREFFIIGQVDFAASEIPFQPDEVPELVAEHKSYQYLPDVAGGTSLMYNLHTPAGSRITSLRLNADVVAKIFTGVITKWQDPEIEALNPGLVISETTIIPVIRSDGSGTSAQLSLYLANQDPSVWNAFVSAYGCPAPCSQWPPFPGSSQQNGSDGVANFVANNAIGQGAVGYVETGYALQRGFPVASLHNVSGNFAQPTSNDVATALRHATLNADLTQNLQGVYNAPESNAYPMSSYSYMITQTTGFNPAKGFVLGTWIIYIACAGQQEAAPLGYSPLPANLVKDVFQAVERIPGAPRPPPLDRQHCNNPNVPLAANTGGSGSGSGGGGSGGSGSGSTPAPSASSGGTATPAGGATPPPAATLRPSVTTLSGTERQTAFSLAELSATGANPQLPPLLLIAALGILLLVFAPILIDRSRGVP